MAHRAVSTGRVDRHRVGDEFTLEDLHGGEGRLAREDGEVRVGKGRGGIEVREGHDLGERGRRGAKKARNGMRCNKRSLQKMKTGFVREFCGEVAKREMGEFT